MPRISTSFFMLAASLLPSVSAHAGVPSHGALTVNLVEAAPRRLVQPPVLTRSDFSHAEVRDRDGRAVLSLTLTVDGADRFRALTAAHVGDRLAVVADGRVVGTPVIRTAIEGRSFESTGFTRTEANELAGLINAHPNP